MKNLIMVLLTFGGGILALYEQSKEKPNVFLLIGSMIIFVYGMYRLMQLVPSKKDENEEE